jgi:DNA polymerase III subunit chi
MTQQVSFYTGVADVVAYAVRLARRVVTADQRLLVVGPQASLQDLDTQLWTFAEMSFITHVWDDAAPSQQRRSAVLLSRQTDFAQAIATPVRPVVLNLGLPVQARPEGMQRMLEVVGDDPADVSAGRAQWRRYVAWGLAPQHMLGGTAP